MRRLLLLVVMTAGALSASAVAASSQTPADPVGLTIRLAEAPASRADDPRAQQYIVDHVRPGAVFKRKVEVTNNTGRFTKVRLYGGGATVKDGAFTPDDKGEVASWVTLAPGEVSLDVKKATTVEATIRVPSTARAGERYGAVWAELPGVQGSDGISQVNRVGVRIYVSVGEGGEPATDFTVEDLTAARSDDGAPTVTAQVRNTGGRAIDMTGTLELAEGPSGLRAGPFPAELGTTLGVGQTAPVSVTLDRKIPAGPWKARITLQSGNEEREATATITFPDEAGETAPPSKATEIERKKRVFAPLAALLLLLTLLALVLLLLRRRRDEKEEDEGGTAVAQAAGGTKR